MGVFQHVDAMLKSTHKAAPLSSLPEDWTEHKAPTGHTYYYNARTKQSTYTRPTPAPPPPLGPSESYLQYSSVTNLPPPAIALAPKKPWVVGRGALQGKTSRGRHDQQRDSRAPPIDKPKSRQPIPGCEPWVLVHTKLGRRFVYNTEKDQSFWRIPDKLKTGILALDQLRIQEKAGALNQAGQTVDSRETLGAPVLPAAIFTEDRNVDEVQDSSEYEEVEVTDDEDEENSPKRQRTEAPASEEPVEFNEDDIAFQLAAMSEEYGLELDEYSDGNLDWEQTMAGGVNSHKDSATLFKDLLNDSGINPYSPWEKLIEEARLADDIRYTALSTMKARKEVWEEWSRDRIKYIRELRAKESKKDPKTQYLAFLQAHATPKLYWPEFKRKYKKEAEMRDAAITDRERERIYRDHINRLKLPQHKLKSDLSALLKAQPLSALNNATLPSNLPPAVLTDVRYISLDVATRDTIVKAYISSLSHPPASVEPQQNEEAIKEKRDRERRQKASEDREKHVANEKRRQRQDLEFGKERLHEEEVEVAKAMNITKKGLKSHFTDVDHGQAS